MPFAPLSEGFLEKVNNGTHESSAKPTLQVLGLKRVKSEQAADRFRILLSDGKFSHSSCMLATQLNEKVDMGELSQNAIIKLEKFLVNNIAPEKKIMIVLDVTVLHRGSEVGDKVGQPQPLTAGSRSNENVPPSRGGAQQQQQQPASMPKREAPASMPKPTLGAGGGSVITGNRPPKAPMHAASSQSPSTPGGSLRVVPIESLTPYQNKWSVRARVTQKTGIKTWSNARGTGKLFSVSLIDESAEIRATGFNEEVDRLFELFEVGKIYYVSRASLKPANKKFTSIQNDYEMSFNRDTQVTLCDEDVKLPDIDFNFTKIAGLDQVEANGMADVLGVVVGTDDVRMLTLKTSREVAKRDIQLADDSGCVVRCTLWGDDAEKFNGDSNPVVALKQVRVSDFGGRSLSVLQSSTMQVNPTLEAANILKGWYEREGKNAHLTEFSRADGAGSGRSDTWKTFGAVKTENLGHGEKPDYYTVAGTVMSLKKENCMYMACSGEDCNKKVIDQGNGTYRCEKCNRDAPNFKWRMILQANLADYTDNLWVTCFQDVAEMILGKSADEVGALREGDEAGMDELFSEANFTTYQFRLRSKMETYNDEDRLKTVVMNATPLSHVEYGNKLLQEIEQLSL